MFWIHPIGFIHASLGWYDLIGGYQPTSDGNLDISPSNILAKAIKIIDAPFVLRHSLHLLLKQPTAYQPSVNFHEFHLSWWNRYFHGIPAATFSATAPLQEDLEELRARGRRGRLQAETSKLEGGKVEVMGHLKRLLIVSFLHCLLKDFRRATVKYITIYILYNWCILFIFVGSWGTHLPKGVLFFSFWIQCLMLGGNQPRGLVEVAPSNASVK